MNTDQGIIKPENNAKDRKISICVFLSGFSCFAQLYYFQPLLPDLAQEFDLSASYSSLAISFSTLGMVIGLFTAMFVADSIPRKKLISAALLSSSVFSVICSYSPSFFLLVALAAMTSSISLMETVVSIVEERFHWKRTPSCLIVTGVSFLIGLLSVFGYSIWSDFTIFHMQMLDFFDYISNNIMMPIVALMTCILVGFVVKTTYVENEIEKNERFRSKGLYRIMIKFICPICMLLILFSSLFLTL